MATLKEQLSQAENEVKRFEALLSSANSYATANNITGKTQAQKEYAASLSNAKKRAAELRKKVTASEQKPLSPKQQAEINAAAAKNVLPSSVDDKLFNEVKAMIPNISPDAFLQGGVGAGILVYMGDKKGTVTSPTGGKYTTNVPDVALSNNVVNSFWADKTIQKKVLNALIASGNSNATQLQAFATWQSVVQQSAQLYAAGKGPKFTPMDILDMSITKAGGAKPDVTTYVDIPKDEELTQILKKRLSPIIMKEPGKDDPVFQSLFNDIKKLYQQGETTTTITNPKTGKKTVTRTGGVSDAMIQAKIDKYYNENNQDFLEAKSLEAGDYFSQWMRS